MHLLRVISSLLKIVLIFAGFLLFRPISALAAPNPSQFAQLESATYSDARTKLQDVLNKYCGQFCQIVSIDVQIDEKVPDGEDMGFEAVVESMNKRLVVSGLHVNIQIDDRVGQVNLDRLANIIRVHLSAIALNPNVTWTPIKLPHITGYGDGDPGYLFDNFDETSVGGDWEFRPQDYTGKAQSLRNQLEQKITNALNQVIARYCPNQCLIEKIEILGHMVTPKEAARLSQTQQVRDKSGRTIFQIDNIEIDVTMATSLTEHARDQVASLMRSKVRFASPINLNVGVIDFPESYANRLAKEREDANDPYGLNKLRQMLKIFRELAGTKEVITNNHTKEEKSDNRRNYNHGDPDAFGTDWSDILFYIISSILGLGLLGYLIYKVRQSKRDAEEMMRLPQTRPGLPLEGDIKTEAKAEEAQEGESKESLLLKVKIDELKAELMELFIENPKVAKETFGRFLKEDGIEQTSKYIHVFGHMVIFELLKDPTMQRELYALSDYYHNSEFNFTKEQEYDLLQKLKTRCTASEIRILTRKSSEKFDFLTKLDPTQVYDLIKDEKIQVQAIVLTQLDRKKRDQVFALYVGDTKVDLMNALSSAEAIPKEFLYNVAKALAKKITARPEFDTENLRTSDILLDLLEKAPLAEQIALMRNLAANNQDSYRSIKSKLVTVNMLPYLKDGHLLELILGMEREDLLIFLKQVDDSIKDLLLSKAPEELADSWIEDLESMVTSDDQSYRLVEMKVLNRIRSLASNGVINLSDINGLIFDETDVTSEFVQAEDIPPMNPSIAAA